MSLAEMTRRGTRATHQSVTDILASARSFGFSSFGALAARVQGGSYLSIFHVLNLTLANPCPPAATRTRHPTRVPAPSLKTKQASEKQKG